MRIHLTGGVRLEAGDTLVESTRFPGRLGRLAFAYLAVEHDRPVPRGELADVLWAGEPPASWEKGTTVLMSKLRTLLGEVSPEGREMLINAYGCYQLHLPEGSWLDLSAAMQSAIEAETALTAGRPEEAAGDASTAASLARREFLPGEDGAWVTAKREELGRTLVRSLDCLAQAHMQLGNARLAVQAAAEATALEPFRESGYVVLMRAHAAAGDRAEALRVHEECRRLLSEELGVDPSPATEAVFLEILRSSPPAVATPPAPAPDAPSSVPVDDSPRVGADQPGTATPRVVGMRPGRRPRYATRGVPAALIVIGAVAAGAVIAMRHGAGAHPAVIPDTDTVASIGPGGDAFNLAVKVGDRPTGVAVTDHDVWVINYSSQTLSRVDQNSGNVVDTRAVGGTPTGIAYGAGRVWITAQFGLGNGAVGSVLPFDATTGDPLKPITVGDGVAGITFGDSAVWVTDEIDDSLIRIDPLTDAVTSRIKVGREPQAVAVEGSSVWVANTLDGTVSRIDAGTATVTATIGVPQPVALAADPSAVWVVSALPGSVTRLDPATNGIIATLPVGSTPTAVAIASGAVWVAAGGDDSVVHIDPATNRVVATISVHGHPDAMDTRSGTVWVTVHSA